jgi:hypothetical protein
VYKKSERLCEGILELEDVNYAPETTVMAITSSELKPPYNYGQVDTLKKGQHAIRITSQAGPLICRSCLRGKILQKGRKPPCAKPLFISVPRTAKTSLNTL